MRAESEHELASGEPTMASGRQLNVVVICPWFFKGDAVGAAARDTFIALAARPNLNVTALWTVNDYADVRGRQVRGLADLLLDPYFLAADVLIYIFAVYHEMFDALLLGAGTAHQIVRFHNVTPKALMPEKHWPIIERSFVQIQNFRFADELWADSQENLEELQRQGFTGAQVRIEHIAVRFPVISRACDKPTDLIRMMFVGRFFESKGVLDLIEAVDHLRGRVNIPFKLTLAGNLRFSDPDYVEAVQAAIRDRALQGWIEFAGSVTPQRLAELYQESHVFVTGSRHEGFCVPVIEALAAGCVPVTYPISNLRYVAAGLTRLSAAADARSLSEALEPVIRAIASGHHLPLLAGDMTLEAFDAAASEYVEQFRPEAFSARIVARVEALGMCTDKTSGGERLKA